MLQKTFTELLSNYSGNSGLIKEFWNEIREHYSARKRHYHNLRHLEYILAELAAVRNEIRDWDSVLFAVYYHDIMYDPMRSDNEEKSAGLAESRLYDLSVPAVKIRRCKEHILATKQHLGSSDSDTNYFTDADLCILGQDREIYHAYCNNLRKEYADYPGLIYNQGRKRVLRKFLSMDRIFKTDYFFNKYESTARKNIAKELAGL